MAMLNYHYLSGWLKRLRQEHTAPQVYGPPPFPVRPPKEGARKLRPGAILRTLEPIRAVAGQTIPQGVLLEAERVLVRGHWEVRVTPGLVVVVSETDIDKRCVVVG